MPNMIGDFVPSIMLRSYLALSLWVIYSLTMIGMQGTTQAYHPRARAGARALRVHTPDHARFANHADKSHRSNPLSPLHDQTRRWRDHANRVPGIRNLLNPGGILRGAAVPNRIFTTLPRKFCGTLTPSHSCALSTPGAFGARPSCSSFSLVFQKGKARAGISTFVSQLSD
jgi:hypothetical protein